MEKVFHDFQKIKPYGNEGDAGNDGYRKDAGIYYQVYAPNDPKANEAKAAKKLQDDFRKLQNEWDGISKIREYNFVFNDKYEGSVILIEEAISELQKNNPKIIFKPFLAKDLENIFFKLNEADILSLGFNIDQRQAVSDAHLYLEGIKTDLDRENAIFAQSKLEDVRDVVLALSDESLSIEYEILEGRCLQKFEKISEAREKYDSISKRFPNDSRPILYLAEIYLNDKDLESNNQLLEKARKIDSDNWLLKLEQLLRKIRLEEKIYVEDLDEKTFPDDPKIKANFYRLYAPLLENSGNQIKADSYAEKAIYLNPDRLSNYIVNLALLETRLFANQDPSKQVEKSNEILRETKKVESKFFEYGDIGPRNKAILNFKKLSAFLAEENIGEFERVSKDTFELLMACYVDVQIEEMLTRLLQFISLPKNDLEQLILRLQNIKGKLSDNLLKALIPQFCLRNVLFTDGKRFFQAMSNQRYIDFINELENRNYETILEFLKGDSQFALSLVESLKDFSDLKKQIIEKLPDEKNIQKEKLRLLLSFDEKDFDTAFEILKQLDLSSLSYIECRPILQIVQQKKAWDFEIVILGKLLEKEKNERARFSLEVELFNTYLNLKKFPETIDMGEQLLKKDSAANWLNLKDKEQLLANTIIACFERGKIDNEAFKKAKELLEKFPQSNPSFEFKVGIEAEVYLNSNEAENALKAVVEGVKNKKLLSSQEYARLYFLFIRIGNQIEDLNTESLHKVQENTYVKLRDKDQWYYIGDEHELDASLVSKTNSKYSLFIDKELEDKVVLENKYGSGNSENEIQLIFTIEKYILWKVIQNFQMLAGEGNLEGVQMIEIPKKEDTIDPQYLLKFFEDLNTKTEPLFEIYCKNNVPLAVLAISEGGIAGAIGRIQNENRGFIHFSVGTLDELEQQKVIARRVVDEGMEFYIDGSSALVLSEIGMLQKIYKHLPNLKVPQSVVNLLAEITNRFRYIPGQTGATMGYSRGKITISSIEQDRRELLQTNFVTAIKLLESNPKNVHIISLANKMDCFSETKVPDELSDACILGQKENLPVLTDDFLYLKMNESETKKKAPEYFSSWALVRVCYEKGYVTFDEYLDYFGYLSSYRFRFLSLTPDDIEKAVFGDGEVKVLKPENIRRLNFPLTLSEEYGVSFQAAFRVVGIFFFRMIMDNAVALDVTAKIFVEIIESFPTKMNKKEFGERLLGTCITAFENNTPKNLCRLEDKLKHQKIDRLLQATEAFNAGSKLSMPN